jgi:hypothetical protein
MIEENIDGFTITEVGGLITAKPLHHSREFHFQRCADEPFFTLTNAEVRSLKIPKTC